MKAFIAPFAVFVLLLAAKDAFGPSAQYWVFPLQTFVCGGIIACYWRRYSFTLPRNAGFTLAIGILPFVIWIAPQEFAGMPARVNGFNPTLFQHDPALYYSTLAIRFLRLVAVVPLAEEIFWRGFLLRYFVRDDFESVPFGTFTWRSFAIVAIGFCFEHSRPDWPAALATGALYNLVAYRTRNLASCVLAHAITNLVLGIYVMRTGQWGFW